VTDHTSSSSPYSGSIQVSCREAAYLLNAELVEKAWFRPDGFIDHDNPDHDVAYVWYKEGSLTNEMQQANNTNTI
jgi:hypothetical protein